MHYDDDAWGSVREEKMYLAVHAKYTQDPVLRSYLQDTHDAVLVEASPFDRVWGVHLANAHVKGTSILDGWIPSNGGA